VSNIFGNIFCIIQTESPEAMYISE